MGGGPSEEVLLFLYSDKGSDNLKHIFDSIEAQFPYVEVVPYSAKSSEDIPDSVWQRATIVVTLFLLPKPELVPNLRWIQLASAGIDHIVKNPIFAESRIAITTASGIHTPAIAEWALLTCLSLSKDYVSILANQKEHKWNSRSINLMKRKDWRGRTIGIVGYGSIGRQVARVFKSMGCQIHAFTASPHKTPESRRDDGYVIPDTGDPLGILPNVWYSGRGKAELHEFLASGLDLLLISVPLTPATKCMFSTEEFEVLYQASLVKVENDSVQALDDGKLPPGEGCIISNPARGAIVDQTALIEALKQGKIQGAALDVTDPEPLPESSELWDMPNVVVTPHLSAHFAGYMGRVFDIVVENLQRREKGKAMVNVVDRDRGY